MRGVTIPVRLTGPFDQLDWQIDWETAGKEALKSRAKEEIRSASNRRPGGQGQGEGWAMP